MFHLAQRPCALCSFGGGSAETNGAEMGKVLVIQAPLS